jgi:hypothetical protein
MSDAPITEERLAALEAAAKQCLAAEPKPTLFPSEVLRAVPDLCREVRRLREENETMRDALAEHREYADRDT